MPPNTTNSQITLNDNSQGNTNKQEDEETPMPWGQLAPLLAVRLSEPINFNLILPFLYKMIDDFGVAETPKDISFYASLLFASFAICQTMTIMYWGRLSDRVGRRPVLIIGLTGTLVSALLFGVAPTFWIALAARSFNGLLAGNVAVMKSVMAEISDSTNRSRMLALLPLTWNAGSMTGTSMGGLLADPAHQYPSIFGEFAPFVKYPYLLPCLIGSSVTLFGLVLGLFKVKETLVKENQSYVPRETIPLLETLPQQPPKQKSLKELMTPTVIRVMSTNVLMCMSMSMADQIYPIFAATPAEDGGLGFNTRSIGFSLAIDGIAVFYLQLVSYPKWERKYGALSCYRWGQKFLIPFMLALPFLSSLASRVQISQAGNDSSVEVYLLWVLLIALLLVRVVGQVLAFTSISMISANIAPSRADLGSMNGMQQLAMSATRVIGPLTSGILWSWSIKHELPYPFNAHLAWVVAAMLTAGSLYMTYFIPESVNTFLADMENQ